MERMLGEPIGLVFYPPVSTIPAWATVHHLDHHKTHNCQGNLMLIDDIIHGAISRSRRKYISDHYLEFLEWQANQDRWE